MKKVVLKNVTKKFDDVVAVDCFNLEIEDREFIVLVGPSGCGKTDYLKDDCRVGRYHDGEIYIKERLVNDLPPKNRDIAMVFQNYALYPHMKVMIISAFGLRIKKCRQRTKPPAGPEGRRYFEYFRICWNAAPGSFPAASGSGLLSEGRSLVSRKFFCLTNPSAIWMPSCVCRRGRIVGTPRSAEDHGDLRHP